MTWYWVLMTFFGLMLVGYGVVALHCCLAVLVQIQKALGQGQQPEQEEASPKAFWPNDKQSAQLFAPQIGVYDPATHIALEQATQRYVQRTGNQPTEQQRRDFLFRGADFSAGLYDREAER